MPKINSLEVVHQDTNKDSYDNLHDLLVSLKGSANKEVIDGQARAAYKTLLEMYVNDKEAFAKRLETLTAEFGTSIAKVLEEWTVYASATEAYARKIEEVSAKAFQNEAKVTEEMYARVTADEAVAKLVTTLRADFENAQTRSKASIREEQIARANADEALASRSFVMEASIADNTAMITEEQLVRATADEALASNITSLTATVATNTASILTEQIARANADEALATQINTVSATASGKNRTYVQTTAPTGTTLVPLVAGDLWFDSDDNNKLYRYSGSSWVAVDDSRIGITAAAVSVETTARVTADEALASQITTVIANVNSNTAAITNETTARATADSALASQITTLTATVNSNTAAITNEATVRANADSALSSQITTLTATVGSKNRTYYQSTAPSSGMVSGDLWIDSDDDKLYRYNGSSWVNIQDNEIAANTTAISNEATSRVNGDNANALSINALTARLDTGDFATVKTTSEATALKVTPRDNIVETLPTWTQFGSTNIVQQSVTPLIQPDTPVGTFTTGAYWFDSNNNYKMYSYNGSSWVAVSSSTLVLASTPWGEVAMGYANGTYSIESPFFNVTAGSTYTVTGDSLNYNSAGSVYFDIIFYNSAGTILKDGTQTPLSGVHYFLDSDTNRVATAVQDTAPTGAVKAKARCVVTGATGNTVGFRQPKVELGGLPATGYQPLNYASAKWGITTNANGYVSGIALNSDSAGTSNFIVSANNFIVKKPDGTNGIAWNGTNSRLDISGDVYANNFYGNVVGTDNINNNAVTIPLTQTSTDTVTGNGSLQTINTVSFNTTYPQNVLVIFNGQTSYSGSANQELRIIVDGSSVALRGGSAINDYPTIAWSGSLAAGSHTVSIQWNGANSNISINNRTLSSWVSLK